MIQVWQDFDKNFISGWGKWWGSQSYDGHIVMLVGPFDTEEECRKALVKNN